MYSFYGGRPGNSFIIIKNFPTVQDMVTAFSGGPNYTDVHYDEYVIINTQDKNSEDNGKIYRRGYEYTNSQGGAEYIGTIVGPSGNAPMVQMTTEAGVRQKQQQYEDDPAYTQRFNQGSYTLTNYSLVPGKQGNTFHDEISWTCCSIRDINGVDTTAYIGFTIPYPVIELQAQTGSPYSQATATKAAELEEHPFYDKWILNIPKGKHGDAFKNLEIIEANENDGVSAYDGQDIDRQKHSKILVYEYYNYDSEANPTPQKLYLGDYNIIEDIHIEQDGTIIVQYSHDKTAQLNKILKWIKNIQYNTEDGILTFTYNTTEEREGEIQNQKVDFKLREIDDIVLSDDGDLTFYYNTKDEFNAPEQKTIQQAIKSIANISLAKRDSDHVLTITYNDTTQQSFPGILWIVKVTINEEGKIVTWMSDGSQRWSDGTWITAGGEIQPPTEQESTTDTGIQLRWLDDILLSAEEGELKIKWNDQDDYQSLNPNYPIKWIENINFTSNGFLMVKQNTDSDPVVLNQTPIKWISNLDVATNGDLTVTYNTTETVNGTVRNQKDIFEEVLKRPTSLYLDDNKQLILEWANGDTENLTGEDPLTSISDVAIDGSGNFLIEYSPPTGTIEYNGKSNWTWVGTFGTDLFNLNDTSAEITIGHYYPAILSNGTLSFTVFPTQFISKLVEATDVINGTIKAYKTSNGDEVTIENGVNLVVAKGNEQLTVTTDMFGIKFQITNAANTTAYEESMNKSIPVLVQVIDTINLAFTLGDRPPSATLDWQQKILDLENVLDKVAIPQMEIYLPFKEGLDSTTNLPLFTTMGDCFIVSCGRTTILVDASNATLMDNTIAEKLHQVIGPNKKYPSITHVIVSHYHIDHIEGFSVLLDPTKNHIQSLFSNKCKFYLPKLPSNAFIDGSGASGDTDTLAGITEGHNTLVNLINNVKNTPALSMYFTEPDTIQYPDNNNKIIFDEQNNPHFSVRFLNCKNSDFEHYYNIRTYNESINLGTRYNNFSLVAEFEHGDITFLSPGDIEPAAQAQIAPLITKSPDIYKLEHHTYTQDTDATYLKKINPKVAFVLGRNDKNLDRYSRSKTIQHFINATNTTIIGENYDRDSAYIISNGNKISFIGDGITNQGLMLTSPGTKIAANVDKNINLNDFRSAGTYYATGNTVTWQKNGQTVQKAILNAPFIYYFKLIVNTIFDSSSNSNYENCVQIAISRMGEIAIRYYWSGIWSNWEYIRKEEEEIIEGGVSNSEPFITMGYLTSSKTHLRFSVHPMRNIDFNKYNISVNGCYMKARQNNNYLAGTGDVWAAVAGNKCLVSVTNYGITIAINDLSDIKWQVTENDKIVNYNSSQSKFTNPITNNDPIALELKLGLKYTPKPKNS